MINEMKPKPGRISSVIATNGILPSRKNKIISPFCMCITAFGILILQFEKSSDILMVITTNRFATQGNPKQLHYRENFKYDMPINSASHMRFTYCTICCGGPDSGKEKELKQ